MSYDLMVFDPAAAPKDRDGFMAWFADQTKWGEPQGYQDPARTTPDLQAWFMEMIKSFSALNGPYASEDYDNPKMSDYSVGTSMIYVTFGWPQMEVAYDAALEAAQKHRVGFFDVSADDGQVWLPMPGGDYTCVHGTGCSVIQPGTVRIIGTGPPLPSDDG